MNNPYYNIENIIKVSTAIKENKDVEFRSTFGGCWGKYIHTENRLPNFELYNYRIKAVSNRYKVGLFKGTDNIPYFLVFTTDTSAFVQEYNDDFVRWLTDWVEYEV